MNKFKWPWPLQTRVNIEIPLTQIHRLKVDCFIYNIIQCLEFIISIYLFDILLLHILINVQFSIVH